MRTTYPPALSAEADALLGGGLIEARAGDFGKKVEVVIVRSLLRGTMYASGKPCMYIIGKERDRVCLGVCVSGKNHCGTESHGKEAKKFKPEYPEMYAVPSNMITKSKGQVAFTSPMISVTHVLPQFDEFFQGRNTSQEWSTAIMAAREAWYAAEEADNDREDNLEEEGEEEPEEEWEGSEDGKMEEDGEGSEYFVQQTMGPTEFTPPLPLSIPEIVFVSEIDTQAPNAKALSETQQAMSVAQGNIQDLATEVPAVGLAVATHFSPILEKVVDRLNHAASAIGDLALSVGDVEQFTALHGHSDLVAGVLYALDAIISADDWNSIKMKVTALDEVVAELDVNVDDRIADTAVATARRFALKLDGVVNRLLRLEDGAIPPRTMAPAMLNPYTTPSSLTSISMGVLIMGDDGRPVMTLGELVNTVSTLKAEVDKLKLDVVSQGGVSFLTYTFASESTLKDLVMLELPSGNAIAAFTDPVSIFSHNKDAGIRISGDKILSEEIKALKESGMDRPTDQRFVSTFHRRTVAGYHSGDQMQLGTQISSLSSKSSWLGEDGLDGTATAITNALTSATGSCMQYIDDHLVPGSKLSRMANSMNTHAVAFHTKLHAHILEEINKLTQLQIPEVEALTLVSEEFILIFNKFFECRKTILDFEKGMDMATYTSRIIWASLKCHMEAVELLKDGLKYHALLSAAFIRFLTKQTGSNVSAGMGAKLAELKKLVKDEIRRVEDTANSAKKTATTATDTLSKVMTKNNLKKA